MKCFFLKCRLILCLIILVFSSCDKENEEAKDSSVIYRDLPQIIDDGTLNILTLNGPISFFLYRDNKLGYDYEFSKHLCEELNVKMNLIVCKDEAALVDSLEAGVGDLIAYRLPQSVDRKKRIVFCEREHITTQVIVQVKSKDRIKDVLDLVETTIHVKKNSVFHKRLVNINSEIGGGIEICAEDDSISENDLISQVAYQHISYTVANKDVARLNKTYFSNLDCKTEISFPQRSAWAVSKTSSLLLAFINDWTKNTQKKQYFPFIYNKYFQKNKYFVAQGMVRIGNQTSISTFDYLFKQYAEVPLWDWRLLAAVAFKESRFDPTAVSWAGARGLMQLMPTTAEYLGLTGEDELFDPEKNVQAAVQYFKQLEKMFLAIEDRDERIKFTLAAYNAGQGHVFDARALALKYGKNPMLWEDNVETYLRLKSDPIYFNDEVCRYGYCRGSEPVTYVKTIMEKYHEYLIWAK